MLVAPEKIRFGRWQLDLQRRILCADDTPVPLNGRGFDLLALLIARHGQAVTRDEIFSSVWPGITVGENNLTVQISNLRKILRANADEPELIVTVPGRGYRFAGELEPPPAPEAPEAPQTAKQNFPGNKPEPVRHAAVLTRATWHVRAIAAAALVLIMLGAATQLWPTPPNAPRLSIAVLPFRSLSADSAQAYLADALTDDLTTDLAHIPASTVIARESADVWRGKATNVQQIGRALRVRYLLEGSLRVEDGHYHVNAQLIDAASGAHLWADRSDYPNGAMSEARNTIVGRLASTLNFKLAQIESTRSIHDRPDDPDALDYFFRARALVDTDSSLAGLTRAQHLLEQALRQQPDFSDAAAELGTVLMTKVVDTDDPQSSEDLAEAHRQITHALALAPQNAQALAARAREFSSQSKWMEASSSATAALYIEPSNVVAHIELSRCARAEGKLDEAADEIRTVLRLSPASVGNNRRYLTLGFITLMQYRTIDAIHFLRSGIAGENVDQMQDTMSTAEVTHILLIAATAMLGDTEQAHSMYIDYAKTWPNRTVWRFGAYFRKSEVKLPAFAAVLSALQQSGMPRFADEHTAREKTVSTCAGENFESTPLTGVRSQTWDTSDLNLHLKSTPKLLIIDVGLGAAVPPGAIWQGWGVTSDSIRFARSVVEGSNSGWERNIAVVMGTGAFGCESYRVAEALAAMFPSLAVKWYRGGEEAWAAAGMPFESRRP